MKESYSEDLANHTGPESCEGVLQPCGCRYSVEYREDALEALTGETTGQAIEPRNRLIIREADLLMAGGRQHRNRPLWQGLFGSRAVGEPWHVAKLFTRKTGGPGFGLTDVASGQVRVWNPKGTSI
jgi:hypothetical protein